MHDLSDESCHGLSVADACSVVGDGAARQAAVRRCQSGDLENRALL